MWRIMWSGLDGSNDPRVAQLFLRVLLEMVDAESPREETNVSRALHGGPQEHFTSGQKVDMTLTFESGRKQTVSVKVAAR